MGDGESAGDVFAALNENLQLQGVELGKRIGEATRDEFSVDFTSVDVKSALEAGAVLL